jgi:hypothetical protein
MMMIKAALALPTRRRQAYSLRQRECNLSPEFNLDLLDISTCDCQTQLPGPFEDTEFSQFPPVATRQPWQGQP